MAGALSTTSSLGLIQKLLLCSACAKTFNEPKSLSCTHSFCKACLENLVKQNQENEIEFDCPTCACHTRLKPSETVAGLPNNDFILQLLSAVGPNRSQDTSECSFCPKEPKEPAITVCIECKMLLGHECYSWHEHWPTHSSHTLIFLSEIINHDKQERIGADKLSCSKHKDAVPKFYCETCTELTCTKCLASTHKKPGHTCVPIFEIFQQQQNAVKSKCDTINTMLQEGKQALETVKNSKETYEKAAKDLKVKHTAHKDELIQIVVDGINKVLADKIQEVDKVYEPACQQLSVQAETISNYLPKVEKSLQRTNEVLENSKIDELMSEQKVIEDDIKTLQTQKPQNLTSFKVQLANTNSCTEKLFLYPIFKKLTESEGESPLFQQSDTVILKNEKELFHKLRGFLPDNISLPLRLCYRANLHGWSSQDFHRYCDNKGPTVVLVKAEDWIFGGYTDQNWQGSSLNKSKFSMSQYQTSYTSFLFSLRNPQGMPPFKCPIEVGQNRYTIYCDRSYGVTFGKGHDLHIANNANTNHNSFSNLGNTYRPPQDYQYGTHLLLAGSKNFQPSEVEVFY